MECIECFNVCKLSFSNHQHSPSSSSWESLVQLHTCPINRSTFSFKHIHFKKVSHDCYIPHISTTLATGHEIPTHKLAVAFLDRERVWTRKWLPKFAWFLKKPAYLFRSEGRRDRDCFLCVCVCLSVCVCGWVGVWVCMCVMTP